LLEEIDTLRDYMRDARAVYVESGDDAAYKMAEILSKALGDEA
jgi:hypothetical protein